MYPSLITDGENIGDTVRIGIRRLKEKGILEKGDNVLLSGGAKVRVTGSSENKVIGGIVRV